VQSKYTPPTADIISGAFDLLDRTTRIALARVCRRTHSIDHFTPEYRDGSLHSPSVKHVAGACPPNNDFVESTFGMIEWALSQSPEQLATILAKVRDYRQSLRRTLTLRAARDDKLIRERSDQLAAAHAKQHANRTKRMAALSQVPILKSIAALHTSLAQHTGKTALHAYLKQQLNVFKYAPRIIDSQTLLRYCQFIYRCGCGIEYRVNV